MRTTAHLISLCALMIACSAYAANAPVIQRSLSAEKAVSGSIPYRDAVERYLSHKEPKVVGGQPAPAGAYPWQVSLNVSWIADPYRAHFCGGAVYSEAWIVTAAHCVDSTSAKEVIVIVGTTKLGTGGTRHNVERIIPKGDYNRKNFDNDIALIQLREPLVLSKSVRAIPLITDADEPSLLKRGTPLVVTGWGATNEGGQTVRDLRFVEVPFVERDTCNRPLAYDGRLTKNMICAGVEVGGKDSCQGDSGGPLTVKTQSSPKLAGVVSWGDGCARPNRVGVYSRVANYANWIASCVAATEKCR